VEVSRCFFMFLSKRITELGALTSRKIAQLRMQVSNAPY